MKVTLRKEDRKWIPVADMQTVRWIIEVMKEDNALDDYARIAVRLAVGVTYEIDILRTEAHVCANNRAMNAYSDDSGHYDVWITTHAMTNKGFVIVGANLTDIWSITGHYEEDSKIIPYMHIRRFEEVTA